MQNGPFRPMSPCWWAAPHGPNTREEHLEMAFDPYELEKITFHLSMEETERRFSKYAFVVLRERRDVRKALKMGDGMVVLGRRVQVRVLKCHANEEEERVKRSVFHWDGSNDGHENDNRGNGNYGIYNEERTTTRNDDPLVNTWIHSLDINPPNPPITATRKQDDKAGDRTTENMKRKYEVLKREHDMLLQRHDTLRDRYGALMVKHEELLHKEYVDIVSPGSSSSLSLYGGGSSDSASGSDSDSDDGGDGCERGFRGFGWKKKTGKTGKKARTCMAFLTGWWNRK